MYTDIIKSLVSLPATDLNFTAELKRATQRQIVLAIETMKNNGGKNKSRIKACERELKGYSGCYCLDGLDVVDEKGANSDGE